MKRLVEALLEEYEFHFMSVPCPECGEIEDEQYHCCMCEEVGSTNGKISVTKLVEALKNKAYDK